MSTSPIEVGMYIVAKAPLAGVEALAATAQDMQFDSIFIWDHLQDFFPSAIWDEGFTWAATRSASPHEWFEFQTLLGYLAGRHPGMRLGVGVTEPIRRHPVVLAQAALTLAHLSQRRPILGIGSGERLGTEPYGLDFTHRVDRLEEALQIIRRCFETHDPFDFDGEHYHLKGAVVALPAPAGRTPEIWIGAHGPRMLQLTGKYGDGWYPAFIHSPADYAARLDVIRTAAREAGRDPDAITPAMHVPVIVAPSEEEARAMLAHPVVRFFGVVQPAAVWQAFGLPHPLGPHFGGLGTDFLPETYDRATLEAALAAVPRAMLEGLLCGTPVQVAATLQAYGDAGMRHVVPLLLSAAVSPDAAAYSVQAMAEITRALRLPTAAAAA